MRVRNCKQKQNDVEEEDDDDEALKTSRAEQVSNRRPSCERAMSFKMASVFSP